MITPQRATSVDLLEINDRDFHEDTCGAIIVKLNKLSYSIAVPLLLILKKSFTR